MVEPGICSIQGGTEPWTDSEPLWWAVPTGLTVGRMWGEVLRWIKDNPGPGLEQLGREDDIYRDGEK